MSAQHKRPGRTARRRRQERAVKRLQDVAWPTDKQACEGAILDERIAAPLLPVPPKQARRLTR